ncbi:MAG: hypothetical protein ACYS6K_08545 [Planctomycetota bacterium]|jgi:hypothetical protein
MNPEDKIKKLINESDITASSDADKKILAGALEHMDKLKQKNSAVPRPNIWRIIMKSPITKLAAVAVIIIACVIGLSFWRTTSSGIALADVLARVEQVRAFRSKSIATINPGKPDGVEFRGNSVMSQEYGHKTTIEVRVDPNGGWGPMGGLYFYPQKKTFIQIGHPIKTYFRWEVDDVEAQQHQKSFSQLIDPVKLLRDIIACKYKNLGRSTIHGIDVEGFRTTDPNCRLAFSRSYFKDPQAELDVKIWVDVKTRLPVRCEDCSSGLDEMGNPWVVQCITTDFEWDISVTAAEFDPPPVPDGYKVVNKRPEPTDEEAAIQGLRQSVELFGNFPETIGTGTEAKEIIFLAIEKSKTPAALRLKEEIEGLTEAEKLDKLRSEATAIGDAGWSLRRLIWFYVRLVQDKRDPVYYGKTVTPKDTDKVLLRWKLDNDQYRVIFGDLSIKNVTPQELAELEK